MAKKNETLVWLTEPSKSDYLAAVSFLSLVRAPKQAKVIVAELRASKTARFTAKDILRASALPVLGRGDRDVEKEMVKFQTGLPLSPILLVRNPALGRVVIADGYHRLCAAYASDSDSEIPCKIV